LNEQVEEHELNRACSTNWAENEWIYDIGGKTEKRDQDGGGWKIIKWI
jgi:hypothetical protein